MGKYIAGFKPFTDEINITDWQGLLKEVSDLYDIHIDDWKEKQNPEEVQSWTRDKEQFLAGMAEENEENLEDAKIFFSEEYVWFGVFNDNDKLVYLCGDPDDFDKICEHPEKGSVVDYDLILNQLPKSALENTAEKTPVEMDEPEL